MLAGRVKTVSMAVKATIRYLRVSMTSYLAATATISCSLAIATTA